MVECNVVWIVHEERGYQLYNARTPPNIDNPLVCAALCRRNPDCLIYQLTKMAEDSIICTLASRYDQKVVSQDDHVTTYIRSETDCRVNGKITKVDVSPCWPDYRFVEILEMRSFRDVKFQFVLVTN